MTSSASLSSCAAFLAILLLYALILRSKSLLGRHCARVKDLLHPAAGHFFWPRLLPNRPRMAAPENECLQTDLMDRCQRACGTEKIWPTRSMGPQGLSSSTDICIPVLPLPSRRRRRRHSHRRALCVISKQTGFTFNHITYPEV